MKAAAILLSAGLSSRMGEFKPLLPIGAGVERSTVLERSVRLFRGERGHPPRISTSLRGSIESWQGNGGLDLDLELLASASLLHDLARTERDHAGRGAQYLQEHADEPRVLAKIQARLEIAQIVQTRIEAAMGRSVADVLKAL